MLRLLLLRHAKAIPATGRDDHARPLVERGRRDAARIGAYIAAIDRLPDLLIDSGAARTRETAQVGAEGWRQPIERRQEPGLYDASWPTILSVVRALPGAAPRVMLVGHNPGLGELAVHLAGRGARSELHNMANKFPTAALAILEFDADHWREVAPGGGLLARFVTPDDSRLKDA
ncbi:MAG: histidine phosphatase family protein [Hyphomicrobiales bacterium]|nr:histidine phosphatase family protein [Hyphomicrobiales bacterium]